ncbi:hypothetical protein [Nocardia rhizosphaerae]|uniref:Uncharacterized protein n=1 Tax=Nocardia rhizosphaerae TaxID=1691571 RepID=A0ABV8KYY0_9NOCA
MTDKYEFRDFRPLAERLEYWRNMLDGMGWESEIHPCMNRDGVLFLEDIGADSSGVAGLNDGLMYEHELYKSVSVNDRQFLEVSGPKFSRLVDASQYIVMRLIDRVRHRVGLATVESAFDSAGLDPNVNADEELHRVALDRDPDVYCLTHRLAAVPISHLMCMEPSRLDALLADGLADAIGAWRQSS